MSSSTNHKGLSFLYPSRKIEPLDIFASVACALTALLSPLIYYVNFSYLTIVPSLSQLTTCQPILV